MKTARRAAVAINGTRTSNFIFGSNDGEALNNDVQPVQCAAIDQSGLRPASANNCVKAFAALQSAIVRHRWSCAQHRRPSSYFHANDNDGQRLDARETRRECASSRETISKEGMPHHSDRSRPHHLPASSTPASGGYIMSQISAKVEMGRVWPFFGEDVASVYLKYPSTRSRSAPPATVPFSSASMTRRQASIAAWSPRSLAASSTSHAASTDALSGADPLGSALRLLVRLLLLRTAVPN